MPSGRNLSEDELNTIRHLIENEKMQQWKVAETLGIHQGTVERVCKRMKLKTQRTGPRNGNKHPNWKGGRVLRKGYWYIYKPDHPFSTKVGYVLEHRLIMEEHLGRYLKPSEVVHHINRDSVDNHIENLIVFPSNGSHLKRELKGKTPNWTDEGIQRINKGIELSSILRKLGLCGNPQPQ